MSLTPAMLGRVMHPEDVRLVSRVFQRIKSENRLPASPEIERSFGRFLLDMFFRGLIIEDKLYDLGVAAANARFQLETERTNREPVRLALRRVAIIEDDYLLASDLKQLFEDAGAIVLGPVAREDDALALLDNDVPDLAIVDLNLGQGPGFAVAEHLRSQSVPFCVLSGYCRSDIPLPPKNLDDVPWLIKPVDHQGILRLAARTLMEQNGTHSSK